MVDHMEKVEPYVPKLIAVVNYARLLPIISKIEV